MTGFASISQRLSPWTLLCVVALPLQAQEAASTPPEAVALRSVPPVVLDGQLDDSAWKSAKFITKFTQQDPVQYAPATVPTEVAFIYDDNALYIGARMTRPDGSFPRNLTRRDQYGNAEHIVISLDPYLDRRTAYSFVVTAGGTRIDYYHATDSDDFRSRDFTYNPVWEAKVHTDSVGWTAEIRIPFSQLRYNTATEQLWGLNITRWMPDKNEEVFWVLVPRDETGYSSRFGTLSGINNLRPTRRIELLPYVASEGNFDGTVESRNPFNDGSELATRLGGDFKMGLGPNLTLEATVNPDFGQVEADPAELNLTAFETFFREQRPFFTEGSQLLPGDNLFYSRRIGAPPRGPTEGVFVDRPSNSTILSAAKVTGRLPSGLSVGVLAAATAREYAREQADFGSPIDRVEVEPVSFFGAARVQQEVGRNASTVGLSLAGMRRDFTANSALVGRFTQGSFSGAADGLLRLNNGEYEFRASAGWSQVTGDTAAIRRIQEAPAHYFQRPDADQVRLNPLRTSLTGFAGSIRADKNAGNWLWGAGLRTQSPSYETNDAGRLSRANTIDLNWDINYRNTDPGPVFRNWRAGISNNVTWNYDGDRRSSRFGAFSNVTLRNYWSANMNVWLRPRGQSDVLTRGGPLMQTLRAYGAELRLGSSRNNPNRVRLNLSGSRSEDGGWSYQVETNLTLRPSPTIGISLGPEIERRVNPQQFVGTADRSGPETFGTRYLFGRIDRTVLSAQFRINYTMTPNLTLEVYAEPFTASGRFSDLGELAKAGTPDLRVFGSNGTTVTPVGDGSITIDDTRNGDSFDIDPLDFNRFSFRSNVVLRWEWTPGSTLFLVWQQDKSEECEIQDPTGCPRGTRPGDLPTVGNLFKALGTQGRNFIAVKASYWIPVL